MKKVITLENQIYEAFQVIELLKINDEILPKNRKSGNGADKNQFFIQSQYYENLKKYYPKITQDREEKITGRNKATIKNYFNITSIFNDLTKINLEIDDNFPNEKQINERHFKSSLINLSTRQNLKTSFYIESEIANAQNGIAFKNWKSDFKNIIKDLLLPTTQLKVYLFDKDGETCAYWDFNQDYIEYKKDALFEKRINNLKEEYVYYITKNNKVGSQKANNYIRSLGLLDDILNSKSKDNLQGFNSIYNIESIKIIENLYLFVLEEQKNEKGIFENTENSSYWKNGFYSAAVNSYLDFLKYSKIKVEKLKNNTEQEKFEISSFQEDCKNSGLNYKPKLITRYISSLATKPFVLLSGLSGSGKTKLAQAFAQWIAEDENQYCIVPVGADWTNREPLLGYVNALEPSKYILPENGALDLIIRANEDLEKPYFLILDEMNLSHVERYFADFLSVMESDDQFKLHSSDTALDGGNGIEVKKEYNWPKNLFVVGTVNIDETTYMFSPKVLDRANVIEFRVSESEMREYLLESRIVTDLNGEGKSMGNNFVSIAIETTKQNPQELKDALLGFFTDLQVVGAEFGYRSASEIQILLGKIDVINPEYKTKINEKIDIAIMQKLLPKLHGSRNKLVPVLTALAVQCYDTEPKLERGTDIFDKRDTFTESIIYPISLEKIERMYDNVIANGFTSYAEA